MTAEVNEEKKEEIETIEDVKQDLRQIVPPVDIYETTDEVVLIADVPGLNKDSVELNIDKDELTIKGTFPKPDSEGEKLISECPYGEYFRTFVLADTISKDKISAQMENGVLTLTLPKQERVKPKKIEIKPE
ncbi:Hsp20 family protein [Candidatus Poribacteria bacterium]|nr:Hsp20 family protein [Candidatus Poribacteria bacterium]